MTDSIRPAPNASVLSDPFQTGFEAGRRSAWDDYVTGRGTIVSHEAIRGAVAMEVTRLELGIRTYPTGVEVKTGNAPDVRPTREGLLHGFQYGIYVGPEGENSEGRQFLRERALSIVRDGQWFDFGEVDLQAVGRATGDWRPMAQVGLIDLPFPQTVFRMLHRRADATPNNIVWLAEQPEKGAPISLLALFVDRERDMRIAYAGFSLYDKAQLQAHALSDKGALNLIFFALWLILNTKGVPQEIIEPAAKLNKARARIGKPALLPYTKVDTVTYINALRETERLEAGGGHHASPRPHLRRAHLRHMRSGAIVPVMATIVNGSTDLKLAQREKYVVKA